MISVLHDIGGMIHEVLHSFLGNSDVAQTSPQQSPVKVDKRKDPYLRISDTVKIDSRVFKTDGERYAVLASSRQGKGYTTGKLIEEMLEKGRSLFIFDPEGEYFTLQSLYKVKIFGGVQQGKENRTLGLDDSIFEAIDEALEHGGSIIFDLSDCDDSQKCHWFGEIGDYIFQKMTLLPQDQRFRIMVVIEEAAIFAPQAKVAHAVKSKQTAIDIAIRGGKRGIDTIFITQRLALVDKTIFGQVVIFLFGKVTSPQDYKAVSNYLGQFGLDEQAITGIAQYHFWLCYHNKSTLVMAGKRKCKPGGSTPAEYKLTKGTL